MRLGGTPGEVAVGEVGCRPSGAGDICFLPQPLRAGLISDAPPTLWMGLPAMHA